MIRRFLRSQVGRKMLMAVTGFVMAGFIIFHLIGNSTFFLGSDWINSYAAALRGIGPFLWGYRMVMLLLLSVHIFFGIQIALENHSAKPQKYAVKKSLRSTFAGRTMVWTGLIIIAYLIYHLLHFTVPVIAPEIYAGRNPDASGRPDAYRMILLGFEKPLITLVYLLAMVSLALHLSHGLQSLFQTLGLSSDRTMPLIIRIGTVLAFIVFLGYSMIPVVIITGIMGN